MGFEPTFAAPLRCLSLEGTVGYQGIKMTNFTYSAGVRRVPVVLTTDGVFERRYFQEFLQGSIRNRYISFHHPTSKHINWEFYSLKLIRQLTTC